MDTLVEFIVKRRKILFTFLVILLTVLLATFELPGYNGNLDGLDDKSNSEFRRLQLTDSLFNNAQKYYFIIEPKSDDRKKIFNQVNSFSKEIQELHPDAEFVSPVKFYKTMIRFWDKQTDKLSDFYRQAREVPLLDQLIARDGKSFICVLSVNENYSMDLNKLDDLAKSHSKSDMNIRIISELHLNKSIEKNISFDITLITILILTLFILYLLVTFRSVVSILYMMVYIFYLVYFQRGIEERYSLPILPLLILNFGIVVQQIWTKYFKKTTPEIR